MLTTDPRQAQNLNATDTFAHRHIGPRKHEIERMLSVLGLESLDQLIDRAVPKSIRTDHISRRGTGNAERDVVDDLLTLARSNEAWNSFIGQGYHGTVTPSVIRRNILENPGWYTQYTPYQAEISQGRLEAMLNFQTMIIDLTGMAVANSSLLDEATAAAEAMTLSRRQLSRKRPAATTFFVSERCHPQTIAVVETRAEPLGITVVVGDHEQYAFGEETFAALVQYPDTNGAVLDYASFADRAHEAGAYLVVAADPMALALLRAPGEFGADIAVGSTQRFGVPLGYGGPHAAYMAATEEFKRQLPGRIVGVSKDVKGRPALRLALQTREQHIRREKATSNICTAQVLLAVMASMYAVYHGPEGIRRIAQRIHTMARVLGDALDTLGHDHDHALFFDTLRIQPKAGTREEILQRAWERKYNFRRYEDGSLGVALDQTVRTEHLIALWEIFGGKAGAFDPEAAAAELDPDIAAPHARESEYLTHPVFHRYRSETEMMRYMGRLQAKDLSLTTSMIPLGSCTMKLNATSEMLTLTHPGFANIHPFAPVEQVSGYQELIRRLDEWLRDITGFAGVSFQPNSGAQGEYAGLQVIRAWHRDRGQQQRTVCLIPSSAHGTNPASAVMAGMDVVVVGCDENGNIDLADLRAKAEASQDRLAAIMVTYPSTHGVFEETIQELCAIVHEFGGQVYLDGANMNALVGISQPARLGADVCHLNLHKTFSIPHGGGGPGMGPICVAEHLVPYLPGHPVIPTSGEKGIGPVAAAPWGSPSILTISYAYIELMGGTGLRRATEVAVLNANYIARRLADHYPVLYTGRDGLVAHECIIDVRPLKHAAGVEADDIAKRLMDYGFHAPTMSWPVIGTLMVEPTESESLEELDRFCDAMILICEEAREVAEGGVTLADSALRHAPHTAEDVTAEKWERPYTREKAAFPAPWTRNHKYWPPVGRVDNVAGDRNLVCSCPPIEAYASE